MRNHPTLFSIVVSVSAALTLACGSDPEPTQSVNFGDGLLRMSISESWVLLRATQSEVVYEHPTLGEVRLSLEDETRSDFDIPLTVTAVKSIVGRELNGAYGGVRSRVSLSGNAMIDYARELVEDGEVFHSQNWVVAKPYGVGSILRVAITLNVPEELRSDPAVLSLIESLDKQVGDATMRQT
jgi:hypothetical protein